MDVPQQQLDQWRDFMERVYVGMWEIVQARSAGNETKATTIIEYVAATALRVGGQMEQAGAKRPPHHELPFDHLHDTEANQRYLAALKYALNAAHDADLERSTTETPASDLLQMLVGDLEREIHGPPPGFGAASLFDTRTLEQGHISLERRQAE